MYDSPANRVFRSVRKVLNFSQKDFADQLNLTRHEMQEIEYGSRSPTFDTILLFEKLNNIPIGDIKAGYVSRKIVTKENKYQLSKYILRKKNNTIRCLLPMEKKFIEQYGEEGLQAFYKKVGFDTDYRYVVNNPINNQLLVEMTSMIKDFENVTPLDAVSHIHAGFLDQYRSAKNKLSLLHKLVKNTPKYTGGSRYRLLDKNEFLVERDTSDDGRDIGIRGINYNLSFVKSFLAIKGDVVFQTLEKTPDRARVLVL